MKFSDHAVSVLALLSFKGVGRAWVIKNVFGPAPDEFWVGVMNNDTKLANINEFEFKQRKSLIKSRLDMMASNTDGVVVIGDSAFPQHRGDVKNSEKPVALFYRGDISLLSRANKNMAVIGLLNPDTDTIEVEQKVVATLVENNICIVSGLAQGCDTVAHVQCLESGGKTIAVLPSPLHGILPTVNRSLAEQIVKKGGLLVTEYYEDVSSKMELSGRYQERDRLQALFSDAIILAASYAKNDVGLDSGSRLAMGYALNYGLPRAILYDKERNYSNPKYDLNRQVLAEPDQTTVIHSGCIRESIQGLLKIYLDNRQPTEQVGLF